METTPGLDSDLHTPAHTPAGAMHYAPSASSSALPNGHSAEPGTSNAAPSQSSSGQQKFSNGPHIRSRITVVCAECKRLKLKCDRRTPCSSCLKRDTVSRCLYSQAAAEKVDVQTLHNRVIEIERVIAQLQAAPQSMSVSAALAGIPTFKQPPAVAGPSRAGPAIGPSTPTLIAGLPCNDRALLAQGSSGSSVVINLEDVVSLWLNELDEFGFDAKSPRTSGPDSSSPIRPSVSSTTVKLEPAPVSIPPASTLFSPGNDNSVRSPSGAFSTLHPPAPFEAFLPPPSAGPSALPQVTAALISYLPSEPARSRYLKAFRETMLLHPSFNVPHFEQRIAAIYTWTESGARCGSTGSNAVGAGASAYGNKPMSKQDLARDIFFPTNKPGSMNKPGVPGGVGGGGGGGDGTGLPNSNAPKPTLSFFSAACAAFALGSLVARDEDPETSPSPSSTSDRSDDAAAGTPAMLFALSEQAMGLFEKTAAYDLDSVIAMILQVLYMLHEGGMSVAQGVFPLVGKMVNMARMMGLAMDPDEFPGTYNLFDAETRRRIWWDVYYYDLFVADCMGHPPLIADNAHTTRLPADVDEEKFTPSCTSLPIPDSADGDSSSTYFGLKCRLAQLVKNVKKQTFRDPLNEDAPDLSIEQAGSFEGEVSTFLQDLPFGFRLEFTQDISKPVTVPSGSPFRTAQKCELAILANRLIIKTYLPFLKEAAATHKPSHPAVFGTISAAHNIVCASRTLHSVWGQTRPAIFDFYDFGRTLFDAAVVCAHAVIQEPRSIVAAEGMKSVGCALDILKELGTVRLGVEGTRAVGTRSEAVNIVELMKRKAEAAQNSGTYGSASAGTKRKHSEVEGSEQLASSASFQLPFVGAAVSSSKAGRPRASTMASIVRSPTVPATKDAANGDGKGKPEAKKQAKEKDKDKEKDKGQSKYISGPLRVRPMTGQSGSRRQRTVSNASTTPAPASASTNSSRAAPPPPSPLATTTPPGVVPSSNTSQIPSSNRASISVPESPSIPVATPYEPYSVTTTVRLAGSAAPTPQDQPMQQQPLDEYAMQYSSPDDAMSDDRRFSVHSNYNSPQSATMYEHQAQAPVQTQPQYSQQSPTTVYQPPTAQNPPGYYMPYPPPPTSSAYSVGIIPTSDPSAGGIAPALTTMSHAHEQHYMHPHPPPPQPGPDPARNGYHSRPIEYQPTTSSHGHPHSQHHPHQHHPQQQQQQQQQHPQHQAMAAMPAHVQGWASGDPADAANVWTDYKFFGGMPS